MKKKDKELIPFEKSKRVIYIGRRGKERKRLRIMSAVLVAAGVLCLLYCISILLFMGYGTHFFLIWGAAGALLAGWGILLRCPHIVEAIPGWIKGRQVSS